MKKNLKRAMALSLAVVATAMPVSNVFAGATDGSIASSFTIDSPALTVTVPTSVKLHVNESFSVTDLTGATNAGDYKKMSLYSDPIKISNATLSEDGKTSIPILATMYATVTPKANAGIEVMYDATKVDENETGSKKVYMDLISEPVLSKPASAANVGDIYDLKGDGTGGALPTGASAITIADAGAGGEGDTPVTQQGAMRQIVIPGPAIPTTAAAGGESTPTYGGFALVGRATTAATWAADDLSVTLYYKVNTTNTTYNATNANVLPAVKNANDTGTDYHHLAAISKVEGLTAGAALTGSTLTAAVAPMTGLTWANEFGNAALREDAYFVMENVPSTLSVAKVALSYPGADGKWTEFVLTAGTDYKTANIYCAKEAAATVPNPTERLLYVSYARGAGSVQYMGQLAKDAGKTHQETKLIITLSDGRNVIQDVNFKALP